MHFTVAWKFRSGNSLANMGVQQEILAVLKPYSWYRPLDDIYVVKVPNTQTFDAISNSLINVARRHPNSFYLLIGPPMVGGQFTGWLEADAWPQLNQRVT